MSSTNSHFWSAAPFAAKFSSPAVAGLGVALLVGAVTVGAFVLYVRSRRR